MIGARGARSMVIKKPDDVPSQQITPEKNYLNRRTFMRAGALAASVLATGWVYEKLNKAGSKRSIQTREIAGLNAAPTTATTTAPAEINPALARAFHVDEPRTPLERITHYNNFYEFSTDKEEV